jgi:hypothetical protein
MKEHPVPHNVLEIEFKLFGNFSIRQFLRILGGCALALGIYILGLPAIVSVPLIAVAIAFGVAAAMGDNFDSKAGTLLSSIITPPRYIWHKTKVNPEFLTRNFQAGVLADTSSKLNSAGNKNKVDIHEVELDQLIKARAARKAAALQQVNSGSAAAAQERLEDARALGINADEAKGFGDAYSQMFQEEIKQVKQAKVQVGPGRSVQLNMVKNSEPRPLATPNMTAQSVDLATLDITQLKDQLTTLQGQLNSLQKQRAAQAEIDSITNQINDVYSRIKALAMQDIAPQPKQPAPIVVMETQPQTGNYLYGIVVDKVDKPLSGVSIKVIQRTGALHQETKSLADGRFQTQEPLPYGDYIVELDGGRNIKFDKYNIIINDKRLPAYKFRAK